MSNAPAAGSALALIRRNWRRAASHKLWLIGFAIVLWGAVRLRALSESRRPIAGPEAVLRVERVIDGDTLLVAGGHRIRLLGVDTPETKHPIRKEEPYGQAATALTRQLIEGQDVKLVFDKERYDDYHRTLAYVFLDDRLINEEIIAAGLSKAITTFPLRADMQKRFRAAEASAQQSRIGIWSGEPPNPPTP